MSRARHLRPFPKGQRWQMTESWKDQVRAQLQERGVGQDWLAQQVGAAGRGTISKLLKRTAEGAPAQVGSSLVPRICEVLGIPLPMVSAPDEKTSRVIDLMSKSSEDMKDAIISMLEAAVKTSNSR